MKLVISPAKSLDFTRSLPTESTSQSCFLKEAESLNKILKSKSAIELSELMSISPSLGELNYQRNNNWKLPFTPSNSVERYVRCDCFSSQIKNRSFFKFKSVLPEKALPLNNKPRTTIPKSFFTYFLTLFGKLS